MVIVVAGSLQWENTNLYSYRNSKQQNRLRLAQLYYRGFRMKISKMIEFFHDNIQERGFIASSKFTVTIDLIVYCMKLHKNTDTETCVCSNRTL